MSEREAISKSTVIFFLGTLLAGFLAGISTSEKIQEWRGLTQAAQDKLQQKLVDLTKENKSLEHQIRSLEDSIINLKGEKLELKQQIIAQGKTAKDQIIDAPIAATESTTIQTDTSMLHTVLLIIIIIIVIIIAAYLF